MRDLMIDIETMGNGANAAMIQIAGCFFDKETGEISGTFCENVSLDDSLKHGFETDPSTVKWWAEQDQAILKAILDNGRPVPEVMTEFAMFARPAARIWSHATFDFTIVNNYFRRLGQKGLNFKVARDIRTLIDLGRIDLDKYDWSKKTHNALDDCKFQVTYCVDALNKIKERMDRL